MRRIRRQETLPYTPEQVFDLVNNVAAYPEFMHWCRGSSVEKISDTEVDATVVVGVGGVRRSFTTRNRISRPERIAMELVDGPFDKFSGHWSFAPAPRGGCVVELNLQFEVTSAPLDMLFAALFEEMAHSQVAALVSRADAVFGQGAGD